MSVDPQKLLEMNRILEAMNSAIDLGGASDDDFVDTDDLYGDGPAPPAYVSHVSSGSIDEMKKILEAFNGAQVAEPVEDPEVREALATKPTPEGVQIGSWKINKKLGETARYDVVHSGTGAAIAKDLYLYDAALGLVRALNEGASITETRVRNLLKLEEDFARNVDDAVSFKARARKLREGEGDEKRAAVAEDRSDEAERQAEEARDRILRLAGLRS